MPSARGLPSASASACLATTLGALPVVHGAGRAPGAPGCPGVALGRRVAEAASRTRWGRRSLATPRLRQDPLDDAVGEACARRALRRREGPPRPCGGAVAVAVAVHCVYSPEVMPQYAAFRHRLRRLRGAARVRCVRADLAQATGSGAFGDARWLAGTRAKVAAARRWLARAVDGEAGLLLDLDVTVLCPSAPAALVACLDDASGERDLCFMREPGDGLVNTGVIAWRASPATRRFFRDVAVLLQDRMERPRAFGSWRDLAAGDPPADGQVINRLLRSLSGTHYRRPVRGRCDACGSRAPLRWAAFPEAVVAGGVYLPTDAWPTLEVFHAHGVQQNTGKLLALRLAESAFAGASSAQG